MKSSITIFKKKSFSGTPHLLPASKSISNRVLILDALAGGGSMLHNLSDANDTQLMIRLLQSAAREIDVEDAGTTMRFLTAYYAITKQAKILTGTNRMKERPIGILVDALRSLGAEIGYTEKEGYPPVEIQGFKGQDSRLIRIRGDVSSQFISALMMVAPCLPFGLTLELQGKVGSKPYIEMTASLMEKFGVICSFKGNIIQVPAQKYKPVEFTVESDWSAASYWFAFTSLAEDAEVSLPRIFPESLQGDHVIVSMMERLGVEANAFNGLLKLTKKSHEKTFQWDFTDCPDLAQTVAVVCAAKGITGHFTGLESLRIKETDRITALQTELKKIGAQFEGSDTGWTLVPSASLPVKAGFATYKDHRMAMAFAPLSAIMDVEIENPDVVRKSYPKFWDDIKSLGFRIIPGTRN